MSRTVDARVPTQVLPAPLRLPLTVAGYAVAAVLCLVGANLLAGLVGELLAPAFAGPHHDFLAFYGAGKLVLLGAADRLYDADAMTAVQRAIVPFPVGANGYMPYINPPFAAAVFAPLAALPEQVARTLWFELNLGVAAASAWWMGRSFDLRLRLLLVALVALSYPVYHALAEGQWSILLLAAGLVALSAARRGAWGLAGAGLAVLWIKPQLVVLPLLALVVARRWRAVAATLLVGLAFVVAALPVTGIGIYGDYVRYLLGVTFSHFSGAGAVQASVWQGDLASTEALNGLLVGHLGQQAVGAVNALWAGLVVALVGLFALSCAFRRPGFAALSERLQLAAGIAVILLVNPNLFAQDTVLAFLVIEAMWPWSRDAEPAALALAAGIGLLVLVDQQAAWIHLFPTVLLGLTVAWTGWVVLDGVRRPALPTRVCVPGARATPAAVRLPRDDGTLGQGSGG